MRTKFILAIILCSIATGLTFYQRHVIYELNHEIYHLNAKYRDALLPNYPSTITIAGEVTYFGNQKIYYIPHNTDIKVTNVLKKWTDSTFSVTDDPIKYPPQNMWARIGDTLWLSTSKYVIVDTPVCINFFKSTK